MTTQTPKQFPLKKKNLDKILDVFSDIEESVPSDDLLGDLADASGTFFDDVKERYAKKYTKKHGVSPYGEMPISI